MASKYEQFFRAADKDNSGYLTVEELIELMREKGYKAPDDKIRAMFRSCDSSGDNRVSLEEYLTAMGELPPKNHKAAMMRGCFREFDKNGDGTIDRAELDGVFKSMGKHFTKEELDRMIGLADKDQSGTLDYEEFTKKVFG